MKNLDAALLPDFKTWTAPPLPSEIPHGDMPGDKVHIGDDHIAKANRVFPALLEKAEAVLQQNPFGRCVVTVCGGSGVGKSETASLLSYYFTQAGLGSYTLSGDNYPHRVPMYNDAERLRIFREGGIRGLITSGVYCADAAAILRELWCSEEDAAPAKVKEYPWLALYQKAGRAALAGYLGHPAEQDFAQLTEIVRQFKNGADTIWLKRMGRSDTELYYENVDFSAVRVLIIEWTHGNSDYYAGVDIPILLNSTPQETAAYRKLRNRDGKTDSAFTTMVLEIEQRLLEQQAHKAAFIIAKSGELLSYAQYRALMAQS